MYEQKIGKVFTSISFGSGHSSYKKIIYRVAVSQRLRNTDLEGQQRKAQVIGEVTLVSSTGNRDFFSFPLYLTTKYNFNTHLFNLNINTRIYIFFSGATIPVGGLYFTAL